MLLNTSRCFFHWFAFAALVPLLLTAQHAGADAKDTFNVTAGSTLMFDNNVFRLAPNIDPAAFLGQPARSDRIITTTATLSMNKLFGMQRFEAVGSLVDNRYHNFDFLDFTGKNYNVAWHWFLTPYFHGTLSSNRREALNNFADLTGFINSTTRNLRTDENHRFEGVFEITRSLHLIGGLAHETRTNSRLTVQDFDNRVLSAEGGIRYALPSGSSLTYKAKSGSGDFFKRAEPIASSLFDTRFNDMEHELRLMWPVTSKTSIDARAAHFERKHENFSERDFAGFIGNFNLNWAITAKTRVTASWARQLSNFQTNNAFLLPTEFFDRFSSSYAATNRVFLEPVWKITEKTALRLRYDFFKRDYLGAVTFFPENRSEYTHSGLIALDWEPVRAVLVSATLQRDHRNSNIRGFDYDSAAASVSARLNF